MKLDLKSKFNVLMNLVPSSALNSPTPFPELDEQRCHWGLVQSSGVGGGFRGLLLNVPFEAIQVAGLIELPCASPEAGGGVEVSGAAVGVVEFLSAIDGP